MLGKIHRYAKNFVTQSGSPYFYIRRAWRRFMHPLSVRQKIRAASVLTGKFPDFSDRYITDLQRDGFVQLREVFLPAQLQLFGQECDKRLASAAALPAGNANKNFWVRAGLRNGLKMEDHVASIALQEPILALVAKYFGEAPVLRDIDLFASFHNESNTKYIESQLWHRDYDDKKLLKLFIYLTDVDAPDHGPFTFIPAPISRTVPNRILPRRITDEQMLHCGAIHSARQIYGKRLTAFMIDTYRCYHLGSRVGRGHKRVAYTATYTSAFPLYDIPPVFS